MSDRDVVSCPKCGLALEEGALCYTSGARWHREAPRGIERAFWLAFAAGERVYGSLLSSPVVSSVPASRCRLCGTVVVWGGGAAPGEVRSAG